jgi:hypothetical protein
MKTWKQSARQISPGRSTSVRKATCEGDYPHLFRNVTDAESTYGERMLAKEFCFVRSNRSTRPEAQ